MEGRYFALIEELRYKEASALLVEEIAKGNGEAAWLREDRAMGLNLRHPPSMMLWAMEYDREEHVRAAMETGDYRVRAIMDAMQSNPSRELRGWAATGDPWALYALGSIYQKMEGSLEWKLGSEINWCSLFLKSALRGHYFAQSHVLSILRRSTHKANLHTALLVGKHMYARRPVYYAPVMMDLLHRLGEHRMAAVIAWDDKTPVINTLTDLHRVEHNSQAMAEHGRQVVHRPKGRNIADEFLLDRAIRLYDETAAKARSAALCFLWARLTHKDVALCIAKEVYETRTDPELWNVQ